MLLTRHVCALLLILFFCCRCSRFKCFEKIDEAQRQNILEAFNNMSDKNIQDSHLTGLITMHHIHRKRPRIADEEGRRSHAAAFSYRLRIEGRDIPICKVAFLSFHGITKHRLQRIHNSIVMYGHSPKDKRGSHKNRPKKIPEPIVYLIEYHIKSFKARQSQYSLRNNPNRQFLPEDLTVSDMHREFVLKYHINIPYKSYWTVFKTFNIHFGYPRSDTCNMCDSLNSKIKAEERDFEKSQLIVQKTLHLKKAEAFRSLKRSYIQKAKQDLINCISFDYMQNLPLPHLRRRLVV